MNCNILQLFLDVVKYLTVEKRGMLTEAQKSKKAGAG